MALVFLSLSGQGEVIRTAATEEEEEEDKLEREESRRGKNPLVGGRSGGVTCVPLSLHRVWVSSLPPSVFSTALREEEITEIDWSHLGRELVKTVEGGLRSTRSAAGGRQPKPNPFSVSFFLLFSVTCLVFHSRNEWKTKRERGKGKTFYLRPRSAAL